MYETGYRGLAASRVGAARGGSQGRQGASLRVLNIARLSSTYYVNDRDIADAICRKNINWLVESRTGTSTSLLSSFEPQKRVSSAYMAERALQV